MKDIQEKRLNKELMLLEGSPYFYRILKKISKEELYIELSYPNPSEEGSDIIFIIHICSNFPFTSPKLFCKTQVSIIIISSV